MEYVAKMKAEGTYRAFLDRRNARRKEKRKANNDSETFICQWMLEITLACITFLQFALYMFVMSVKCGRRLFYKKMIY